MSNFGLSDFPRFSSCRTHPRFILWRRGKCTSVSNPTTLIGRTWQIGFDSDGVADGCENPHLFPKPGSKFERIRDKNCTSQKAELESGVQFPYYDREVSLHSWKFFRRKCFPSTLLYQVPNTHSLFRSPPGLQIEHNIVWRKVFAGTEVYTLQIFCERSPRCSNCSGMDSVAVALYGPIFLKFRAAIQITRAQGFQFDIRVNG